MHPAPLNEGRLVLCNRHAERCNQTRTSADATHHCSSNFSSPPALPSALLPLSPPWLAHLPFHPCQAPCIPALHLLHPQSSGELKQLLVEKLGPNYASAAAAPPATAPPAAAAAPEAEGKAQLQERIKTLLASSPVMLFMKGVPDAPRCGFSRKVRSLHWERCADDLLQCLSVLDCFCEPATRHQEAFEGCIPHRRQHQCCKVSAFAPHNLRCSAMEGRSRFLLSFRLLLVQVR